MKCGMDNARKLPTSPGQRVYILEVIDYLNKWVETGAYHEFCDCEVNSFIWKNVIYHFEVPKEIVIDNGSQFISFDFQALLLYPTIPKGQWESRVDK